jgi:hypothetical protein
MAQAVEHLLFKCLLCECEVLGSNPRPTKKKEKKRPGNKAYMVEYLLSKFEALSSNPSISKKWGLILV